MFSPSFSLANFRPWTERQIHSEIIIAVFVCFSHCSDASRHMKESHTRPRATFLQLTRKNYILADCLKMTDLSFFLWELIAKYGRRVKE